MILSLHPLTNSDTMYFNYILFVANVLFLCYNVYNYKKKETIRNFVERLTDEQIYMLMSHVSKRVIVPNWYTKKTLEHILDDNAKQVDDVMMDYIIKMYPSLNNVTDKAVRNWIEEEFEFVSDSDESSEDE